uniref:Polyprotein n=1 Tax=Oxera neriifolia associated virus TaxID=2933183 RepID=A0A9C7GX69_9VIRU|nr:polyprotein [Oxera neriifolia associated virus]
MSHMDSELTSYTTSNTLGMSSPEVFKRLRSIYVAFSVDSLSSPHTASFATSSMVSFHVVRGAATISVFNQTIDVPAGHFIGTEVGIVKFHIRPLSNQFVAIVTGEIPTSYYDHSRKILNFPSGYCYLQWFHQLDVRHLDTLARILGSYPKVQDVISQLQFYAHVKRISDDDEVFSPCSHVNDTLLHVELIGQAQSLRSIRTLAHLRVGGDEKENSLDSINALSSTPLRIDPSSDRMLSLIGFSDETTKKEAVKSIYLDKNSRLREVVDKSLAARLSDHSSTKNTAKKKITVYQCLKPEEERSLESSYPEFEILFKNKDLHPHGLAAASRKLETELILSNLSYSSDSKPLKGFAACVVDVGGNWASHMLNRRKYVHSCCPILDAYDDLRHSTRLTRIQSFAIPPGQNKISQQFQHMWQIYHDKSTRGHIFCRRRSQQCRIKCHSLMAIHSLYDNTLEEIGDIMISHNSTILEGTMVFCPEILLKPTGVIEPIGANFEVDLKEDTIEFFFSNDPSLGYSHKFSRYCKFFRTAFFSDTKKSSRFYLQFTSNRLGVQFFTIHRSSADLPVPRSRLRHRLWFSSHADKLLVKYYDFDVRQQARLALKEKFLIVPKATVNALETWALRLSDQRFNVVELFNYACSINSRQIHGGTSVTTNEALDARTLVEVTHAVYLHTYSTRYNLGKIDQQVVNAIKRERSISETGVFSKLIAILKQGSLTKVISDLWSSLDRILATWIELPDHFDVRIEDSVKYLRLETLIDGFNGIADDEVWDYQFTEKDNCITINTEISPVISEIDGEQKISLKITPISEQGDVEKSSRVDESDKEELCFIPLELIAVGGAFKTESLEFFVPPKDVGHFIRNHQAEKVFLLSGTEDGCFSIGKNGKITFTGNDAKLMKYPRKKLWPAPRPTTEKLFKKGKKVIDSTISTLDKIFPVYQPEPTTELVDVVRETPEPTSANDSVRVASIADISKNLSLMIFVARLLEKPTSSSEHNLNTCTDIVPFGFDFGQTKVSEQCPPETPVEGQVTTPTAPEHVGKNVADNEEIATETYVPKGFTAFCSCKLILHVHDLPPSEIYNQLRELPAMDNLSGRKVTFFSKRAETYRYGKICHRSQGWPSLLENFLSNIVGVPRFYDHCLFQVYEAGAKIPFHRDDESCYSIDDVQILTVNLCGSANFSTRCHRGTATFRLEGENFFVMPKGFQRTHAHSVEVTSGPRISLTFRNSVKSGESKCEPSLPPRTERTVPQDVGTIECCDCWKHVKVPIEPDGDCLYTALIQGLDMGNDVSSFKLFLAQRIPDMPLNTHNHLQYLLTHNVWGDSSVFPLVCKVFKVKICVHFEDQTLNVQTYTDPDTQGFTKKICLIHPEDHFDLLRCLCSEGEFRDDGVSLVTLAEDVARPSDGDSIQESDTWSQRGESQDVGKHLNDSIEISITGKKTSGSGSNKEDLHTITHDESSGRVCGSVEDETIYTITANPMFAKTGTFEPLRGDFAKLSPIEKSFWGDFTPSFVDAKLDNAHFTNAVREIMEYWRIYTYRQHREASDLIQRLLPFPSFHQLHAMRADSTGPAVFDLKKKVWLIPPPKGDVYKYGHDGKKFHLLPRKWFRSKTFGGCADIDENLDFVEATITDVESSERLLITSKDMQLLQETNLYNACKEVALLKNYTPPEFDFINGVPGCGKTTYIIENHKPSTFHYKVINGTRKEVMSQLGDLVLTATTEAAKDLRSRLTMKRMRAEKFQYRTIDSLLLNYNNTEFERIWIDEALMSHFGVIVLISALVRPKKIFLIGDRNQIPFICRLAGVKTAFHNPADFLPVSRNLSNTYRCPIDVAALLSSHYPCGMKSLNPRKRSLSFERIRHLGDVPKREDVQYLTFKQMEKRTLLQQGYKNVKTVHEFQGSQARVVYVVRLSNKSQDPIYNQSRHTTVAISRHTEKLVYFLPFVSDELYRRVSTDVGALAIQRATAHFDESPLVLTGGGILSLRGGFERVKLSQPDVDPLPALQFWYDSVLPVDSTQDQSADQAQVMLNDISFQLIPHEIRLPKTHGLSDSWGKMVPKLRTGACPPRANCQRETLLAFAKRNSNVPQLNEIMETQRCVKLMVENFTSTFIDEKNMCCLKQFQAQPLFPSSVSIGEWLADRAVGKDYASYLGEATALWEKDLGKYSYMTKRIIKPALDHTATTEYKAAQTIVYPGKDINAVFSPIFRTIADRLQKLLKKNFCIFSNVTPEEFGKQITKILPPSKTKGLFSREVDFSKYDKSQGLIHLLFETEIFQLLGLPKEFSVLWYAAHYHSEIKDHSTGFKSWLTYQRRTGDAATFIGNTIVCMGMLASLFDLKHTKLGLFSGDDSLLLGEKMYLEEDRDDIAASVFNMESKFFTYEKHYFCSKFLVDVDDNWVLVPDPLKVVFKLGRKDLVNQDHVSDLFTSMKDLLKVFADANINQDLNRAVSERYKTRHTDHTICFAALAKLVESEDRFRALFDVPTDGAELCADPTRKRLD